MPANCILRASKVNETLYRALIRDTVNVPAHYESEYIRYREREIVSFSFFATYYLNCYGLFCIITLLSLRVGTDSDKVHSAKLCFCISH